MKDPNAQYNEKKSTSVNIQKIKCINENLNVNGIQVTTVPELGIAAAEAQVEDAGAPNDNGLLSGEVINFDKNLVNVCVNVNVNEQANAGEDGQTCEECFTQNLDPEEQNELLTEIREFTRGQINSFEELCENIVAVAEGGDTEDQQDFSNGLLFVFTNAALSEEQFNTVLDCLNEIFNGVFPPPQPN